MFDFNQEKEKFAKQIMEKEREKFRNPKNVPHIVLLDISMPVMDGFELLEKINQEKLAPDAKKIILSNLSQDADVERGNKLGISGYIVKASSTPSEVLDKVNKIMEQK